MRFALSLLLLTGTLACSAQEPTRPLVVMNLAAHPDDEDGSTLAYYRNAEDAIAYSVIYTRGEGGQNEIGPELYERLGAIRTEETERAARHLGTQVFFLNFEDFGYSKSADEAFARWGGRDNVTARITYLLRKLKPDVLFTNHDTLTGHGHHQAVALSAYDAFELAADATYHPEQLKEEGVDLWQPKRMFLRRWRDPSDARIAVPVGAAIEGGPSASDLAVAAVAEHRSQGFDKFAPRFRTDTTYFVLLRSATDAPLGSTDLAANLPPNTAAVPDLTYAIDARRAPALPAGALTLGAATVVPGQQVRLTWDVDALPSRRARWVFTGAIDTTLYLSDTTPGAATLDVAPDATPTVPKYVAQYSRFNNYPPVSYALYQAGTDSLLAAGYLPLEVAPPLFIESAEPVVRLTEGVNRIPVAVQLFDPAAQRVVLNLALAHDSTRSVLYQDQKTLTPGEGLVLDTVEARLPSGLAEGTYTIALTALAAPTTRPAVAATDFMEGRVFEVEVPENLRVGVVASYDNTLDRALAELGVEHVLLDSMALATGDFSDLHTILIDIRAYLVRQDLRRHNDRLLDWVERGGHLIVNYQKTFEWNEGATDPFDESRANPGTFAPYPLTLGRDRVSREDAAVEVLVPEHPLFHVPNTITASAWADWEQERGLYFPARYDDAYVELFSMNDPGEAPLRSSTLLADYGDGTYMYTALGWYRQLKAFHPGVYAFFANMISLPLYDTP